MVPGQHLVAVALAGGEPGQVDAVQFGVGRGDPAGEGEVLGPAVEAAALAPDPLDDGADPAVAAREQTLDQRRLAVVVAHPDRAPERLVGVDGRAQLAQPVVDGLGIGLRGPLERRVRLGHEAADRDRAADVLVPGGLPAGPDDVVGHLGDLEDVLVGLGGQAAHEVELDLAPALGVRGRGGADQVVLADHLVDDAAQPLRAALGRERQAGAAAVAARTRWPGRC